MRNRTKDLIFEEAYKLFISKPYELVTIRDLEETTEMTRGAVFYYVKNKLHLFEEVMNNFFLTAQNPYVKFGGEITKKKLTLLEFIELFIKNTEKTINKLYTFAGVDKSDKSQISKSDRFYLSLVLTAGHYLTTFNKSVNDISEKDKAIWSFFIRKAIDSGEVRQDTDAEIYGEIFFCLYRGKAFVDAMNNGLDTNRLKQLFMEVYNKIKV